MIRSSHEVVTKRKVSIPSFLSLPHSIAHTLFHWIMRYIVQDGFCPWFRGGCTACSRGRDEFQCGEDLFPSNHARRTAWHSDLFIIIIGGILVLYIYIYIYIYVYIYNKTSIKRNILTIKVHREVGPAKDLSAPLCGVCVCVCVCVLLLRPCGVDST